MKMPIDLYSLTPAERTLFDGFPEALDSGCETVCCFYLRYSSDKQTEQSIEGQLRDLLDFCKRMGYRFTRRNSSEPHDNFYRVPAGANTKIFPAITGRGYFF